MAPRVVDEHLNHLGIVAEVCREIGVTAWLLVTALNLTACETAEQAANGGASERKT